ncbi:hypothetical protein TOPH_02688 [Tolypocladium ophioglossoides CBS 100239]|uniref:CENP-V/GFA domain-containing protein n=1 Tax=Tolypocladium ophioglossoides (strain CBS 100239) TaxID=1163406 RepID=A0A0L0NFF1_TOLOC|nr:hypothetical protein TOPH_02688 [Tolypocladium ophioglossoides CBS 100239]
MDHLFCPKCGASICIDFRNREPKDYGVSARTINGIDLDKINYKKVDGANKAGPAADLSGQEHGGKGEA